MNNALTELSCGRILCEAPTKITTECKNCDHYYFEFSNTTFKECAAYTLWYLDQQISYGENVTFIACDETASTPIDVIICN